MIGLAPAFSASARAGSFSINDVSGNYVELADGWTFGNGVVNFNPVSQVGLVTFTPATGTFHEDLIVEVLEQIWSSILMAPIPWMRMATGR